MIQGSCLCRGVQYEYSGDFGTITVCHCGDCRKAQGTSNVIAAPVDATRFTWVSGESLIVEFDSSPGKKRAFCGHCGAPLYSRRVDLPKVLRLRMGSIDSHTVAVPTAHIYASGLPAWAQLDDHWPRYDKLEPERE